MSEKNPHNKTMSDLAQDALDVQNACNLSGVVLGMSRAIAVLRDIEPSFGTDAINSHPVCVLWADKIGHLTNSQNFGSDVIQLAYRWAYDTISVAGNARKAG